MSNLKELKDEELEKVSGGWRIDPPDCPGFIINPKYDRTEEAIKYNETIYYGCRDCLNFQRPEGPCDLNYPTVY